MPTVPTSFVPQVSQGEDGFTPLQAPPVEGVRNLAADQTVKFGESLVRGGNVAFRIGMQIQDSVDEAAAKAADVNVLKAANQTLRGEGGYLNTSGKDAITGYQSAYDSLVNVANNQIDSLENSTQKTMATQAISRNMIAFQAQMGDHKVKESKVFAIGEASARADEYVSVATIAFSDQNKTDKDGNLVGKLAFDAALGTALLEARKVGMLRGFPVDSEQMKSLEVSVRTAVTTGVVDKMMRSDQFARAIAYVNEQNLQGFLEQKAAQAMLSSLDANRDLQMTEELTNSIMKSGNLDTFAGTSGYGPVVLNAVLTSEVNGAVFLDKGLDVSAPFGTEVVSPSDGVVVSNDKKSVSIRMIDGTLVAMDGLSVSKVYPGMAIRLGQAIGTSDQGSFHLSMKDGTGFFDPRNVNSIDRSADQSTMRRPETLREMLHIAGSIPDSEAKLRRNVQKNIIQKFSQQEQLKNLEYNNLVDQVDEFLSTPKKDGFLPKASDIDPAVWGALRKVDQAKYLNSERKVDELDVLYQLASGEKQLTEEFLRENFSKLTPETRNKLWKELRNPQKLDSARIEARDLNDALEVAGLDELVNAKGDKNKETYKSIRDALENTIENEQVRLKRSLSPQEREHIIDKIIMSKATYDRSWFSLEGNDYEKSIVAMTQEEILNSYADEKDPEQDAALLEDVKGLIMAATEKGRILTQSDIAEYINDRKK